MTVGRDYPEWCRECRRFHREDNHSPIWNCICDEDWDDDLAISKQYSTKIRAVEPGEAAEKFVDENDGGWDYTVISGTPMKVRVWKETTNEFHVEFLFFEVAGESIPQYTSEVWRDDGKAKQAID